MRNHVTFPIIMQFHTFKTFDRWRRTWRRFVQSHLNDLLSPRDFCNLLSVAVVNCSGKSGNSWEFTQREAPTLESLQLGP